MQILKAITLSRDKIKRFLLTSLIIAGILIISDSAVFAKDSFPRYPDRKT